MDQSSASLPLLPYAQASPAQLAQAIFTAKEALGPNYSDLPWQQWYEAFAYYQPLLLLETNQVRTTDEGLVAVVQYFDAQYTEASSLPPTLPPSIKSASGALLPPDQPREVKRTYSLYSDVLETLERVSFWRRVNRSALVNLAVKQLMATYPESQIPLPTMKV